MGNVLKEIHDLAVKISGDYAHHEYAEALTQVVMYMSDKPDYARNDTVRKIKNIDFPLFCEKVNGAINRITFQDNGITRRPSVFKSDMFADGFPCYIAKYPDTDVLLTAFPSLSQGSFDLHLFEKDGMTAGSGWTHPGRYPIFPDERTKTYTVYSEFAQHHKINEPCIFIGSYRNWGHWISNGLSRLATAMAIPGRQNMRLVFNALSPIQYEMLEAIGVNRENIMTFPVNPFELTILHCKEVWTATESPNYVHMPFLQSMFHPLCEKREDSPRRVYISRRSYYPRHRVENIDEIESVFASEGFTIVNGISGSLKDQCTLLGNAEIVAASYGADAWSTVLSSPDTSWIFMLPRGFIDDTTGIRFTEFLNSPWNTGNRVTNLISESTDPDIERPAWYDPIKCREAIREAASKISPRG